MCGCLPVTGGVTTVPTQQRVRVLWSSAPPLLTACLDDSKPQFQPGDVIPTAHATCAAQPGVDQRPIFKRWKTAALVRLRELSDLRLKEVALSFPDSTFGSCGDCKVLQGREQRLSQGCGISHNPRGGVCADGHAVSAYGQSCNVLRGERTQSKSSLLYGHGQKHAIHTCEWKVQKTFHR
ncbi:hypothetical protein T12_8302 [Trichinella patagoniensis]|uniref:Uncharacterized protein n=1 Tax=Trichinella patagoniensis TaxID=990121 RepID=A0A0V0ZK19_9BILA|nr:hypothetical protein T12_8302 [Trichinella patagoniensis]